MMLINLVAMLIVPPMRFIFAAQSDVFVNLTDDWLVGLGESGGMFMGTLVQTWSDDATATYHGVQVLPDYLTSLVVRVCGPPSLSPSGFV